jgi:DNA-binding NtrC family response regulator
MPKMDGLTLLQKAREQGSDATFIMMTAFASVETAVEAMRAGRRHYLVKPAGRERGARGAGQGAGERALTREAESLREQVRQRTASTTSSRARRSSRAVYDVVSGPPAHAPRCSFW